MSVPEVAEKSKRCASGLRRVEFACRQYANEVIPGAPTGRSCVHLLWRWGLKKMAPSHVTGADGANWPRVSGAPALGPPAPSHGSFLKPMGRTRQVIRPLWGGKCPSNWPSISWDWHWRISHFPPISTTAIYPLIYLWTITVNNSINEPITKPISERQCNFPRRLPELSFDCQSFIIHSYNSLGEFI